MESLTSFLFMGGYASFIWPSYGIVAIVLLILVVLSFRTFRFQQRRLVLLEETKKQDGTRHGA